MRSALTMLNRRSLTPAPQGRPAACIKASTAIADQNGVEHFVARSAVRA